ncbi:hypothetical protein HK096_005188 [Nowakowskiella sp. JEL0078]|nr:hypothetical protein HK096_005188 [Nowakowskiella sp. JEL0078]
MILHSKRSKSLKPNPIQFLGRSKENINYHHESISEQKPLLRRVQIPVEIIRNLNPSCIPCSKKNRLEREFILIQTNLHSKNLKKSKYTYTREIQNQLLRISIKEDANLENHPVIDRRYFTNIPLLKTQKDEPIYISISSDESLNKNIFEEDSIKSESNIEISTSEDIPLITTNLTSDLTSATSESDLSIAVIEKDESVTVDHFTQIDQDINTEKSSRIPKIISIAQPEFTNPREIHALFHTNPNQNESQADEAIISFFKPLVPPRLFSFIENAKSEGFWPKKSLEVENIDPKVINEIMKGDIDGNAMIEIVEKPKYFWRKMKAVEQISNAKRIQVNAAQAIALRFNRNE